MLIAYLMWKTKMKSFLKTIIPSRKATEKYLREKK